MNRTDRLLAILLELQARGERRAEDLAATFETSKRTIYRDIQALCEAGVPVVAIPGRGYSLDEGYFLPPLSFTVDEATLLLLGAEIMAQSFDADYQTAAQWAARKIEGVLPAPMREKTAWLVENMMFVNHMDSPPEESERLRLLRRAMLRQQTVRFRYHTRYPDQAVNQRDADPYALVCVSGTWYMTGYCHLRKDRRTFRLSRIDGLTALPRTFARPTHYRVRDRESDAREVTIRLLFDPSVTTWLREERFFFISERRDTPDGLLLTLRVRHIDEAVQWVLGWGKAVRVLEPEALQQRLIEEAQGIMGMYG
jgi:predicted DNA-binding transcriptional regulator YafY